MRRTSVVTPDGLVVALRPLDPHAPWIEPWRRLSDRALVDNLFYHPDFALSAAGAFGAGVQVALVGDRAPEEPGLRLLAAWPIRRTRLRWGIPLTLVMGWMHDFGVFGAPLLDAAEASRALDALFFGVRLLVGKRVMLTFAPTRGAFADLLSDWLGRHRLRQARFWAHERAFLDLRGKAQSERAAYLDHLSARRRRKFRQSAERLEADGPVTFETVRDPGELAAALDDHLAVEAQGWKGRRGTAIAAAPSQAALMRGAVASLGARGCVRIDRLRRNERTLASVVSFVTRDEIWTLKIAFDESVARHSPGTQLFYRLTQSLIADGAVTRADSCAPPNFALPETFWTERRALAHILVETRGGDRLFALAARLERLRADIVTWVRAWVHARRKTAEADS
ncbi:GNAT family N-acetyltransferase [Methylobacterium sp. BTF04]|nr:GNAT family N-acetyltransferase [Methylobacterium sp. BTF04]